MDDANAASKLPGLYWWHAVLLVDDEPEALRAVARSLKREPYDLIPAESARAALECLSSRDISLVVADRRMPEMEGDRLLEEVWRRSPTTVGAILSGYPVLESPTASDRRPRCVMAKPWDDASLKRTIRTLLLERERELHRLIHR